jgi:putative toxin-antitoxin system antitoxin component (TIGR02293 family)
MAMTRTDEDTIARTVAILGGEELLGSPVRCEMDVHDLIVRGLPGAALRQLIDGLSTPGLKTALETALGLNARTLGRHGTAGRTLTTDQGNRVWAFAAVLAQADDIFGSRDAALAWLNAPAIGLGRRRPVDLLSTGAGVAAIRTYLCQIDHGVHV